MKKILTIIVFTFITVAIYAQVPYFSGTVGDAKLYGYTSLKTRPGINNLETYTTFQYGVTDYVSGGLDLYTSPNSAYMGLLIRGGYKFNKRIGVGVQITPSFNLNDNFKFSYLTSALYLNGAITDDGKLFWCSNTWWGVNKGADNTITNWEYLGYAVPLKNGDSITPMMGMTHSWQFDEDPDMAAGFYYTHKNWNFYLWGNDFFKFHPRAVVGVDFTF